MSSFDESGKTDDEIAKRIVEEVRQWLVAVTEAEIKDNDRHGSVHLTIIDIDNPTTNFLTGLLPTALASRLTLHRVFLSNPFACLQGTRVYGKTLCHFKDEAIAGFNSAQCDDVTK